jgi:hypothetical protein
VHVIIIVFVDAVMLTMMLTTLNLSALPGQKRHRLGGRHLHGLMIRKSLEHARYQLRAPVPLR